MATTFSESYVRDKVAVMSAAKGGVRALAKHLGISPSYVSDVCNGRRAPGPPFLEALGFRRIVLYTKSRTKRLATGTATE